MKKRPQSWRPPTDFTGFATCWHPMDDTLVRALRDGVELTRAVTLVMHPTTVSLIGAQRHHRQCWVGRCPYLARPIVWHHVIDPSLPHHAWELHTLDHAVLVKDVIHPEESRKERR